MDYDVCMLSYSINQHVELPEPLNVNRVIYAQTASGYVVNANYIDKLIALYEVYNPLLEQTKMHWLYANDVIWKEYQATDNWYYFKKRIGKQRPGYSDLCNQYVERNV